jgi:hypothetical protein
MRAKNKDARIFVSDTEHLIRTKENFLQMQICSNIPPERSEELEQHINQHYAAGTQAGWSLSAEEQYTPVQCASEPGCWHYIFEC